MEMSEILDRAKELATRYEANGYIHRDATLLLPNLVAECEFWQQRAMTPDANGIAYMRGNFGAALDEIKRQANHIAKLESTNEQLRVDMYKYRLKQRAALKKLGETIMARGKALVEERIAGEFSDWIENQCPHWDIDVEPFCAALDGPCEYREGKCPIRNELLDRAREQLRVEGKL